MDLCARCAFIELRFERRYTMVVSCCSYGCANRFGQKKDFHGFLSFSSRAREKEEAVDQGGELGPKQAHKNLWRAPHNRLANGLGK